jgi:acetyl-CoA acetyltransferase
MSREIEPGVSRGAIAGLGITELGKVYGRSAGELAVQAVLLALEDAGLERADLDGLLISHGIAPGDDLNVRLARQLGLRDLALLAEVNCFGASAAGMVAQAAMAVAAGMAQAIACVWADTPLEPDVGAGASYARRRAPGGLEALPFAAGLNGANPGYALAARRHMATFGTTSEQLGAIAVQTRAWATMNPRAQMRDPITLEDHQRSRLIADPLRLLDCCVVSNGGIAVIVTGAERAAGLRQPPVHVLGFGQGHPGYAPERGSRFGLVTGASTSGARAMRMAGFTPSDVDVCELYDCYTITTLLTLEDYGFCEKGEGGAFAASGALGPGGSLPTNTGGGQLSGYYMWGMTPLSEGVIQARGQAGERQVDPHDVVLVSGNGGILDHHGTLIFSPHRDASS